MATKTTTKGGTQTTERIIGTAALHLSAAAKSLNEAFGQSGKLEEILQAQSLSVTDYEGKISSLETEYAQKKAENDFKLNMDYKTNEAKLVAEHLQNNNLTAVDTAEYKKLNGQYFALKNDFEKKISEKEVEINTRLAKDFATKEQLLTATFSVKEAENTASINQLKAQLVSANGQVEMWKGQLDAERNASIERSKHGAIGSINLPSSGK